MKPKEDCIFCKIVKGEMPCYKIYEDKDVLSFLDINPYCIGHVLVIPKKHSRWLWDLNEAEYTRLVERTHFLANKLRDAFKTEWVEEVVAGIGTEHTHIHLQPRKFDDGLGELPTKPIIPKPTSEEMKKIQEKIVKVIK
ncbi:HIT domain protein [uncultured archaeon]|nr:HIT domain protein [uncultured archaeon]